MLKDKEKRAKRQQARYYSKKIEGKLFEAMQGLLVELDQMLDRRLVATFFRLLQVLILHRHRNEGLWLSELGNYLMPEQGLAGVKRINKLLHSSKWDSQFLAEYLWQLADQRVAEGQEQNESLLAIWDECVVEKPESSKLEGLCAVWSSKATRLKRIKPGYFNPPGGRPIFTPGFHWLQVLVCGLRGPVTPAHARLWTTRGAAASTRREQEREVLWQVTERWGPAVIHVFDRGFAGSPWLTLAFVHAIRFILRWPKDYRLADEHGVVKKAWQIARGKRSWEQRQLWDTRRRFWRKVGMVAFPVIERTFGQPLWLVVSRQGPGKLP